MTHFNTQSSRPRSILAGLFTLGLLTLSGHAAPLTSWTQYSGSVSSGLATASPVLGNGTADSADNQSIYAASATSYTLTNIGDSIVLSSGVTFSGLASPQADQFRFGIYDVNGQLSGTGWLGYFATNSGTSAGSQYSRLWERDNPNTGSFGSGAGATQISFDNADPSNTAFVSGIYTLSLNLTRVATGIEIEWTLIGTNVSYSVIGSYIDTTPQTYNYNRVGFFTGGGLNANQVSFSNVNLSFTPVPEPATWSLILGSFVCGIGLRLRRRSS